MIALTLGMLAQGLTGTDWAAVSGLTAMVGIVVGVVTAWANHLAEKRRRADDRSERVLFRRLDRAERKRLLALELAAARRERLARNYGAWFRAMTATILNKMRAVLSQGAADKEDELLASREKEVVEAMSRMHERDHADAYGYLADLYHRVAELKGEASEGIATHLGGVSELAAFTLLIQLDESPDEFKETGEIAGAVAQFDGHDVAASQKMTERATVHVTNRVEALRSESAAQLRDGRLHTGRA